MRPHATRSAVVALAAAVLLSAAGGAADDWTWARALLAAGRADEALPRLEAACRARPGDFVAHYYLAYCYGRSGRLVEARRAYEVCIALDRDRPECHYNLGVILNRLGLYDDAGRAFEEALLLDPGNADANFNCGLAHYYARRPLEAIRYYREALVLAPGDADVLYYLALAYEGIDARVALDIWDEYLREAARLPAPHPFLETARERAALLRAAKTP